MPQQTAPVAIVPSDCFRWQPQVQLINTFRTRQAALDCAFEHGYRLVVERNEGNSAQFDVLNDPDGTCTADLELEILKTEEVLVEPCEGVWGKLMLSSLQHLTRRFATAVAGVHTRVIASRLCGALSGQHWKELRNACRRAGSRFELREASGRARRLIAELAAFYRGEVVPFCRSNASRFWWSGHTLNLRRQWDRYSHGSASDAARRLSAEASVLYHGKVVPFCRSAATDCWWSDRSIALRRSWHRYSDGTLADVARRLAAEASVLCARVLIPRLRQAVSRCRQADLKGTCRRAWSRVLLTAIRLTDGFAAAAAAYYTRQVAPRLRQAAARCQQANIEGAFRHSIEAVAPPQHSNASQLH